MPEPVPDPERLEYRFDHYSLGGQRLDENEWIAVELPGGLGTKYGRFAGTNADDENKPVLTVYRDREPEGQLTFPPQIAKVRRSTEDEVLERSVERPEPEHDRVQAALERIERAQNLLSDAAQELSPVLGYADEGSAVCRIGTEVQETWHTVDQRRTEIAAQTLRLGDDGGGERYFLSGRPVHAGDVLEFFDNDDGEWKQARFEWTGLLDDPPLLHLDGNRTLPLPESTEHNLQLFRWPSRR